MNEQFVTNAIEKDRYLKAMRLVDRFETDVMRELENTCKRIIENNPKLFPEDYSLSTNKFENSNSLRTLRVEVPLNRKESTDQDADRVKFYTAIEWTEPEDRLEETPSESSLCVAHYKMRPNPRADYDLIKSKTKQDERWQIRCGDDVHDSDRGVFYIPITDGEEMKHALAELREHFSTYGHHFGVDSDEN